MIQSFYSGRPARSVLSAIFFAIVAVTSCKHPVEQSLSLRHLVDTAAVVYGPYIPVKLPLSKGVKIANPIQLAMGPGDVLYAANATGEVYSLRDTDGDGIEDTNLLYCDVKEYGLRSPSGFTSRGDTIYIGTAQQIRAFIDFDKDGKADSSWVFFDDIPTSEHPYEWTCGLSFGPDGWLYCALTTDSWNAGASPDPKGYRGSILRISPNGKIAEPVARGIRSVYGMAFNEHGDLFFTDNEGGGNPNEELNQLVVNGFYGHNPKKFTHDSITGPIHVLQTEMAPSGIEFNKQDNDFGGTGGDLFIAFYGPGERWTRGGVARIHMDRKPDGTYSIEEHVVADIPKLSNLAFGKDGSLYLAQHGKADYWYNAIYDNEGHFYKLVYDPSLKKKDAPPRVVLTSAASPGSVDIGKELFAQYACLGCHAVDDNTELLGPNLKNIGKRLSRNEIMDEIMEPSRIIKPSMMGLRITKRDGQVLLGRVVNTTEDEISMMLIGNHVVQIRKNDIAKMENEKKSLMYEGLVNRMSATEKEALLDYIVSLSE